MRKEAPEHRLTEGHRSASRLTEGERRAWRIKYWQGELNDGLASFIEKHCPEVEVDPTPITREQSEVYPKHNTAPVWRIARISRNPQTVQAGA